MTSTVASQHHGDEGKGELQWRGCLDSSSLLCKFSARLTLKAGDLVRTQYMPHDISERLFFVSEFVPLPGIIQSGTSAYILYFI